MILITQYYKANTKNFDYSQNRQLEIDYCLLQNVSNIYIKEIHLLVEKIYELPVVSDKIVQVCIGKRLTYYDAFNYYNINLKNQICILANADIYMDNSLDLLNNVNFSKIFLALNRYENNDNTAPLLNGLETNNRLINRCNFLSSYQPSIWSQDVWVWKTNHIQLSNIYNFELGIVGCDNYIAFLLNKTYTICNPSFLICINHYDRLNTEYIHDSIIKGTYSKKNTTRIMDKNSYIFLENINDIPDRFTTCTNKIFTNKKHPTISCTFDKTITCIDWNTVVVSSSSYEGNNTPNKTISLNNESWIPLTFSDNEYIEFDFGCYVTICVIDIIGKPVNRTDKTVGYISKFKVGYFHDNTWNMCDTIFDGINIHNGNYIKKIYLESFIYCNKIRLYAISHVGVFYIKLNLYKLK